MTKVFIILALCVIFLAGGAGYQPGSRAAADAITLKYTADYAASFAEYSRPGAPSGPLAERWVTYGKTSYGDLRGFVAIPEGVGPFPTIIFNHGSKQQPEPKKALVRFFNDLGYAVFLPQRRGYGNSAGPSLDDALTLDPATQEGKLQLMDRIHQESDDVMTASSYIRGMAYVDLKRIVISGYSFGGSSTVFVARKNPDFVAGIAFTTASGIWRHGGIVRQELIDAVRDARIPMMFVYAENDYDISPGVVFSREMRRMGKPVSLRIYPFGETEQEAHEIAIRSEGIKMWGPDVMKFINQWMP